jgi:DNA processing protein
MRPLLRFEKMCTTAASVSDPLLPWFQLKSAPGIGNHLFKRLVERFGDPRAVLEAPAAALAGVEGVTARLAQALKSHRVPAAAAAEIETARRRGYQLVTMTAADYPPLLREIPDPPPYLYVRGTLGGELNPIAVVGSRQATAYGEAAARQIAADLARLGFTVVSGMALGIDAAAHEGALGAGGRTVAVLGSGLDNVYPPQHRGLFARIAQNGAVVSEFPLDAGPEAHHFPQRNRVISGMSFGTVVVEATRRSGALITARLSAEQNREVFAVPGSIHSFKSTGTHMLIKQGAKLVENAQDIVAEIGHFMGRAAEPVPAPEAAANRHGLTEEERQVMAAMGPYPEHIDRILRRLAMDPGTLSGTLLQLELKGMVRQLPGKFFAAAFGPPQR